MAAQPQPRWRIWHFALLSVVAVVALTFVLPKDLYLCAPNWDLREFVAWRAFAADSIRGGHFPLWNPYTYAGEPFLGDFQSAELYPPNVIFLFLPLVRAINLSQLLHVLILGWGVRYWAAGRGFHPFASILAGLVAAMSGPVILRLPAGQLTYLIGAAWAPWILWGLEAAWRGPARRPLLITSAIVGLQILGGHPQYVFYVAIAAGLHAVMRTVLYPAVRRRALPMVAIVYLAGAVLAAAQLLPGLAATSESVRSGRLDFDFVRISSFPLENFLTFLAPGFFNNLGSGAYWGRWYLWEVCPFVGVTGIVLAVFALGDRVHRRYARADLALVAILFLLALGDNTPLLRLLYDFVPGFDKFRSLSKFAFPAMLFGMMALAAGADALIQRRPCKITWVMGALLSGVATVGGGVYFWMEPTRIRRFFDLIVHARGEYLSPAQFADPGFIHAAGVQAGQSLAAGGALLLAAGVILLLARRWPWWRWVLPTLLPLELFFFVHANLVTTHSAELISPKLQSFIAAHPGDYRVINPAGINGAYLLGAPDMWGDNPGVLRRYSEFMNFLQGDDPDKANQIIGYRILPRIFTLLRFQFAFVPSPDEPGDFQIGYNPDPLPHALLVANYQVLPGRDAILPALTKPDFNPRQSVLLETEPMPRPQPNAPTGAVNLTVVNGDLLIVEADTPVPVLLLITDLYSRDWHARALFGSSQSQYEILPADYILRAIPLAAGHHRIAIEFAPPSVKLGLEISAVAWLIWAGACAFPAFSRRPQGWR